MKSIRCGRGLGDSIYLQSVVRHLVRHGSPSFRVATDYPDVFRPLGSRARLIPFTKVVDIIAHYAPRKNVLATTQFEDCCIRAGIRGPVELKLDWTTINLDLHARMRCLSKPPLVVQMPRAPMGRTDGFGASLMPRFEVLQRLVDEARETHSIVQVGAGKPLYRFRGLELDLANQTTVADLIDVVAASERCLGYVSFLVPLAESLGKPAHFVWSERGLNDPHPFIRQITPQKILHNKQTSTWVLDREVR